MRREGLGAEGHLRPRSGAMSRCGSHASVASAAGSLAYSLEAFETFEAHELVRSSMCVLADSDFLGSVSVRDS